jgi:hypothetical protein
MKQSTSTSRGDYILDTDKCDPYTNAELTIHLKLGFRAINPEGGALRGTHKDGDGQPRATLPWGAQNWQRWLQNFVRTAEHYWSGRFWLVNNFPVLEIQSGAKTYRPNEECKLKITPLSN